MTTIGEKIRKLRKAKGISASSLAVSLGVSSGNVSEWETKNRVPRIEMLHKIADFFGVNVREFEENQNNIEENTQKIIKKTEMTIAEKAILIVNTRELAKIMAKVYDKPLQEVLNELEQNTTLQINELLNAV